MGWLSVATDSNKITLSKEYALVFATIAWSYTNASGETSTVEYNMKREKLVETVKWVGMTQAAAESAAAAKLVTNVVRSASERENEGNAYSVITVDESYPVTSAWTLVSIVVRSSGDT